MSMYGTIGKYDPEYLLADPNGCDKIAVPLEPGNGTIERGTVLYRKTSGMYAPAGASEAVSTNSLVVLDEKTDTNASMAVAEDTAAYRAGRLIAGKVTLAGGAAVTAAVALALRQQGIVLDQMDATAPEFDNGRAVITYKANGGTGDDVTEYANHGSAYSIAANTFTAPSGKTFSKWNTNAEGTGADYAAAASYTADADLTLYAVWANQG